MRKSIFGWRSLKIVLYCDYIHDEDMTWYVPTCLFDIMTSTVCVRNLIINEDRNLCLVSCEIWVDLSVIQHSRCFQCRKQVFESWQQLIHLSISTVLKLDFKTNFSWKVDCNLCSGLRKEFLKQLLDLSTSCLLTKITMRLNCILILRCISPKWSRLSWIYRNLHWIHGYQKIVSEGILQSSQAVAAFLWSILSIPVPSNFAMSLPLPRTPLFLMFGQTRIKGLFIISRIWECDTIILIWFLLAEGDFGNLDQHVLSFSPL